MTEEKDSVEQDAAADALTVDEVRGKVRTFVGTLLNGGAKPPDIAFSLAYVATEFGLAVAEGSVQVFPVVLSAVTSAEGTWTTLCMVLAPTNSAPNSTEAGIEING